jgi:hypothetical protein
MLSDGYDYALESVRVVPDSRNSLGKDDRKRIERASEQFMYEVHPLETLSRSFVGLPVTALHTKDTKDSDDCTV